jgi:hypothetical protein
MKAGPIGFVNLASASVSSGRMPLRPTGGRLRLLACAGLALYALFLVASPFEHHDLSCELKTPQHCTACTSSLVGSDPDVPTTLDSSHLTDAGKAAPALFVADGVLLPARSSGRSPPSHS